VGYLTAGDELDDLVRQAVPTYINVGSVMFLNLLSLSFGCITGRGTTGKR
jgi:hypothetical protein